MIVRQMGEIIGKSLGSISDCFWALRDTYDHISKENCLICC